jgi:transposase-like protein
LWTGSSLRKQAECKEAVLVARAILADGRKVLLSLGVGNRESQDAWREFFRDMIKRGLRCPLLVVSDGCPGLVAAVNEVFAKSRRQRCIAHKLRNIANKLPRQLLPAVLPDFRAIFYAADRQSADTLVAAVVAKHQAAYPAAVKCLLDDLDACLAHLEFPESQRRFIRTTNLLERAFVEQRRRTKIIPGFFSEPSCLKLVFGTLIRVSAHWRRVKMTTLELDILRQIRKLMGGDENSQFLSLDSFTLAA